MATPGQLVKAMAETLGIPVATVTQYDRALAESGLRSKGGRGLSAAKVTASDAANLLIAILGSPVAGASVKVAADTCRTYGQLPFQPKGSAPHLFSGLGLPQLKMLPKLHTLADSIEALITGASEGHVFKPFRGGRRVAPENDLSITLWGPIPRSFIDCYEVTADEKLRHPRLTYRVSPPPRQHTSLCDMHQSRAVSFNTIRVLGSLLVKENA